MKYIADLHVHSKFSRGCSTNLTLKNMEKWAKIKGVEVLGTSDFTHPEWIKEIKNHLVEDDSGVLKTTTGFPFILQTEISLIYTQAGKGRRVHVVILAPNFAVVEQITEYLKRHGRVDYDGRPIFKIPAHDLVYELRNISPEIEVIPAHIWTPWFSMFGSNSGFDSIHECFKDQAKNIHVLETGLSSDPPMNWRLSQLDNYGLVSFSDSHSFWPWRLGREATILDLKKLNYKEILRALRTFEGLSGTVEVNPAYGKYHVDGHRNCGVIMNPSEAIKNNNICPVCKKPLTLGVAHRVEELADRKLGFRPKNARDFHTLIPLSEVIAKLIGKSVATKSVWQEYNKLLKEFKSEYKILLSAPREELIKHTHEKIADAIMKNRIGGLKIKPGYDGVYGEIVLDEEISEDELEQPKIPVAQKGLNDFF